MLKINAKISIVGAGLSGLAAAINLEKAGFSPVIYEATSEVGGRVKTDLVDGYQLDHGFQVLLDAYPKAQEYFDYDQLDLQRLLPGALIYSGKKALKIGDPSRHFPFLISTLDAGIGNMRDLYLMWTLHREVQRMTDEEIFRQEELSTMEFLRQKGFSEKIISTFFKPFFTGIFLEPDLMTSSRMFCFVFRMFGRGYAAIPVGGMGALSDQLLKRLKNTTIAYNTPVSRVEEGKIILRDGREIDTDLVLIATEPHGLLPGARTEAISWHGCDTLYFETEKRSIGKPLIGLVSEQESLINNIFYPTSIACESKGEKELLSVTVVKAHNLAESDLVRKVVEELRSICKIENPRFIKRYQIRKALPELTSLNSTWNKYQGKVGEKIFLAGDYLMYGSSNAALLSGENAAQAIIEQLSPVK